MKIPEKLLKFKYPIILTLTLSLTLSSLIIFAPSFLTILTYFWPLFLSTSLFLVAVIFFGKTSAHPGGSDSDPADKAGEGLLDYVAAHPGGSESDPADKAGEGLLDYVAAHPGGSDSDPADKAGEGLLDYVAGQPELTVDSYKSE